MARKHPSWEARRDTWMEQAMGKPQSESQELSTGQIPGAAQGPHPLQPSQGGPWTARWMEAALLPIIHLPAAPSWGPQMLTQQAPVPSAVPGS